MSLGEIVEQPRAALGSAEAHEQELRAERDRRARELEDAERAVATARRDEEAAKSRFDDATSAAPIEDVMRCTLIRERAERLEVRAREALAAAEERLRGAERESAVARFEVFAALAAGWQSAIAPEVARLVEAKRAAHAAILALEMKREAALDAAAQARAIAERYDLGALVPEATSDDARRLVIAAIAASDAAHDELDVSDWLASVETKGDDHVR